MTIKQVILARKDLEMPAGKLAAQVAHASVKVFFDRSAMTADGLLTPLTDEMATWFSNSFTKVVLGVKDEQQLMDMYQLALVANIPCSLICDQGRTVFNGEPTYTCVAIGPDLSEVIDTITRKLILY